MKLSSWCDLIKLQRPLIETLASNLSDNVTTMQRTLESGKTSTSVESCTCHVANKKTM